MPNMTETLDLISGLFLPVAGKNLLLPNVSIAEVIDYQIPNKQEQAADWYLGNVTWRGQQLPVMSYELANQDTTTALGENPRIIVINTIGPHNSQLPFLAIVTQNIPRLVKVDENSITEDIDEPQGPIEKMRVTIQGETASIPNLELMESMLYQELQQHQSH